MKHRRAPTALFGAALLACVAVTANVEASEDVIERVTIYRDSFGVPHVYGDTAEALFYAGGYALMQDRMAEFERSRRAALGRMAELDPEFLEADKRERRSALSVAETKEMFERLSPEYQRLMRAQIAGMNKAIEESVADPQHRMPYEFLVLWGIQPKPWTLHDYISTFARHRQWAILGSHELKNMEFYLWLLGRFGEETARLIFDDVLPLDDPDAIPLNPSTGPFPASLSGAIPSHDETARAEAAPLAFAQVDYLGLKRGAAVPDIMPGPKMAPAGESRSVIIAPKRSASGQVLMLQATSDGPQIRYFGAGFDAYGYTRQGGGPLVMGRGTGHGWLQNVGLDDQVDIYAEKLNPGNHYQYWYRGQWRDMTRRIETIKVRGGEDVTTEVVTTVHGPIVLWDEENDLAYAEKNAVRATELNDWVCYVEWMRARDLAEFEKPMPHCSGSATINYGGEDGTIASWHLGRRPVRVGALDPRFPTPGTGEYEWEGWVPFSQWSKFKNPADGFFHAWNTRPSAVTPYRDRGRWGATSRNYLAYDLLQPLDKVSADDLHEINRKLGNSWLGADPSISGMALFLPYLSSAVAGDARLMGAVELMASWDSMFEDRNADGYYDSPAIPLLLRWLDVAREEILADDLDTWEPRIPGSYRNAVLFRAIQREDAGQPVSYDWFNGQERREVLHRTVSRAVEELSREFETDDMAEWRMRVYWHYYDSGEFGKHPDQPSRRRRAYADEFSGWSGTTAASLGIIPYAIPDNGSERWNAMMEVSADGGLMVDASSRGGQNQFIDSSGKATVHIGDQLIRHANFQLKTVPMNIEELRSQAESRIVLQVPAMD